MSATHANPSRSSAPSVAAAAGPLVAVGHLRAFVTLLVLAHHAVLAYHPYAPPPPRSLLVEPRWWQAFPIVDPARSTGFAVLVGFNDTFFMSLMFLLSGLFVWGSLRRKGAGSFLRDRGVRLGVPFVIGALLAPLAYYPSYLQAAAGGPQPGFAETWLSLGNWPAGPVWFLWVLLAFDALVTALFVWAPTFGDTLAGWVEWASRRPVLLFGLLVLASAAVYVPMTLAFHPLAWTALGPFTVQTSRALHYFVYFLFGIALGAAGLERGLLARDGRLARQWPRWIGAALVLFAVSVAIVLASLTPGSTPVPLTIAGGVAFALSCAATSLACVAVFARFAATRHPLWDSLRDNAYGMYLVHYAMVSWLQYALLPASLPAVAKAAIVFTGTVALSWATTMALRRAPRVASIV